MKYTSSRMTSFLPIGDRRSHVLKVEDVIPHLVCASGLSYQRFRCRRYSQPYSVDLVSLGALDRSFTTRAIHATSRYCAKKKNNRLTFFE